MSEESLQIGKYRIVDVLGQGGFATVYRAEDTTLNREVALKVLHPQLLADKIFVQRFLLEARTIANLRHPNIITVFDVGQTVARLFIAMQLVRGSSLADMLKRRKLFSYDEMLTLLKPIFDALSYAHAQGVVHRDLKPANILLEDDRSPLLTDFGFARLVGENSLSLSLSGGISGTPGYIAPEVWDLNSAEIPADIYALGCIVYELLTGKTLFSGQTPMQAMRAHDRGPQFPETWPAGVPDGIVAVLQRALARDPAARYASADAFWQALANLRAGVAPSAPFLATLPKLPGANIAASAPAPGADNRRRLPWLSILAAAGLVLVVAVTALLLALSPQLTSITPTAVSIVATNTAPSAIATITTLPTATPTPTATPSPTAITPSSTPTPPPAATTSTRANLRAGPSTIFRSLGSYPSGTSVMITGREPSGRWLRVRMPDNQIGWMSASVLRITIDQNTIPLVETPALPTNTPVPPTNTPVPPTNTPVPPIDTAVQPIDTPAPSTNTAVRPAKTSVPATHTPAPGTNTPAPGTNTPMPATNTPMPATPTPMPATNTPMPATPTPKPTPTSAAIAGKSAEMRILLSAIGELPVPRHTLPVALLVLDGGGVFVLIAEREILLWRWLRLHVGRMLALILRITRLH